MEMPRGPLNGHHIPESTSGTPYSTHGRPEGPKLPAEVCHVSAWLWDASAGDSTRGNRIQVTLDNRGDYCGSVLPPVPRDSHGHVCDPHSSLGKRGCCLHFHSENVEAQRGPAPLIPVALEVEPGVVWL